MNAPAAIPPDPQHMQALRRANKVRLARAELKRRIAEGETSVGEVILTCPWEAASMTIADLLMSQRRWGHSRCRELLGKADMSEARTVGALTDRQRRVLAMLV